MSSDSDDSDGEIAKRFKVKRSPFVKTEIKTERNEVAANIYELTVADNKLKELIKGTTNEYNCELENENRVLPLQSVLEYRENLNEDCQNEDMDVNCADASLKITTETSKEELQQRTFQPELRFQLFLPSQINCSLSGDLETDFGMNHFWVTDIQKLASSDRSFFTSLFYLMSTYPNVWVTNSCSDVLTKILGEKPSYGQYITCLELATVLVNLGASFSTLNVEPQWTQFTEDDIKKAIAYHFAATQDIQKQPNKKNITNGELDLETNLHCILNIIMLTSPPNSRTWKDAASIFLMLVVVAVDENLPVVVSCDLNDTFLFLLDSIKNEDWSDDLVNNIASKMCNITSDHRCQSALVRRLPSGVRGNLLKKQTAMTMLRNLLNICPPSLNQKYTLNDCLFIVKTRQMHQLKDYSMLNSIIQLLDEFICCDIHSAQRKIVSDICNALGTISNLIRDQINCDDGLNVKVTMLCCKMKWKSIAKSQDAEKTIIDSVQ